MDKALSKIVEDIRREAPSRAKIERLLTEENENNCYDVVVTAIHKHLVTEVAKGISTHGSALNKAYKELVRVAAMVELANKWADAQVTVHIAGSVNMPADAIYNG